MQLRHVLGFVVIPLALLLVAHAIRAEGLWSVVGNLTIPWFCSVVALAVLVLGVACLALQVEPGSIPARPATCTVIGTSVILAVGLLFDNDFRFDRRMIGSGGEWLGFTVVLAGVFALARRRNAPGA